jgi:hypothetical protein
MSQGQTETYKVTNAYNLHRPNKYNEKERLTKYQKGQRLRASKLLNLAKNGNNYLNMYNIRNLKLLSFGQPENHLNFKTIIKIIPCENNVQ